MDPVYVSKNPHEKAMQRALIQYRNPDNYDLVKEALIKADRRDLIGYDAKCLIHPRKEKWMEHSGKKASHKEKTVKRSNNGTRSGKQSERNGQRKSNVDRNRSGGQKRSGRNSRRK